MVGLSMTQTTQLIIICLGFFCVCVFFFHFLEPEIPAVLFLKTLNPLI